MAKKATPQEPCMLCDKFPCECNFPSRRKVLRECANEHPEEVNDDES